MLSEMNERGERKKKSPGSMKRPAAHKEKQSKKNIYDQLWDKAKGGRITDWSPDQTSHNIGQIWGLRQNPL